MSDKKTKVCCTCKCRKPVGKFNKNRKTKDGLSPNCKHCANASSILSRQRRNNLTEKPLEPSVSQQLLNEALDSCLERLTEIDQVIVEQQASKEAVEGVIVDLVKANKLEPMKTFKNLTHGSFRYHRGELTVRLNS